MKIRVFVFLKKDVLDPQGKAVRHALENLGYKGLGEVRVSRIIDFDIQEIISEHDALNMGKKMAQELLANEVIEDYEVEIIK